MYEVIYYGKNHFFESAIQSICKRRDVKFFVVSSLQELDNWKNDSFVLVLEEEMCYLKQNTLGHDLNILTDTFKESSQNTAKQALVKQLKEILKERFKSILYLKFVPNSPVDPLLFCKTLFNDIKMLEKDNSDE